MREVFWAILAFCAFLFLLHLLGVVDLNGARP